jgi:RNA polymerase-binding protein DksA
LNPALIAELREQLCEKKAELNDRVIRIKKDIASGLDSDSEEQATQLENQEVLDSLANEATSELAQINMALQRMAEGSYGICTECGSEIDTRRLEARPFAARCIACASKPQAGMES